MAIATLSIDIEARLAKLQDGLDKAGRLAEKNAEQMRASYLRAGSQIAGIAKTISGAFVGYSVVRLVQANIDALDSFNDVNDATGASIEKISALEQVALRTGGSMSLVSDVLVKFNQGLNEGNPNGPITQALKSIGLSAAELKKLDPADALRKTAEALNRYAADGNRARLVQELFGKSVKEAGPFIKDLAEFGELNATVTAKQVEQAEKFNRQLFELKANVTNSARSLTSQLIPALNGLFDRFNDNGIKGLFGVTKLKEEIANLNLARFNVGTAAVELAFAEKNAFQALANPEGYKADIEARKAAYAAAVERAEALQSTFYKLTDGKAGGGRGFVNPDVAKPSAPVINKSTDAAIQAEQHKYEGLIKKIQERLDVSRQELTVGRALNDVEKFRASIEAELASTKLTPAHLARVKALTAEALASAKLREAQIDEIKTAEAIAALDQRLAAAQSQRFDGIVSETVAMRNANEEIGLTVRQVEALRIARMEHNAQLEEEALGVAIAASASRQDIAAREDSLRLLREQIALRKGGIAKTDAIAASPAAGAQAALDSYFDKVKRVGDATRDAFGSALQNAEDSLLNFFRTGELNAAKFADEVISQILRIALVRPLVNSAASAISSFFGIPGVSANGNVFAPSGMVTGFAAGGVFNQATPFSYGANQLGVLGEAGPEGVLPLKRGSDGKLGVIVNGGGKALHLTYAPVFQIDGTADRAQSLSTMQQISQQSQRELLQFLKAKGVY